MQNIRDKGLPEISAWHKEYRQEWISHGGSGVMRLDMNPHKASRIVGYNIVYVMFLVVCNSIIDKKKIDHFIGYSNGP